MFPRAHHTLVAELLPAPMFDDPTLGHPFQQVDGDTGVRSRHSVILAARQPADLPLTWSHDHADNDPAGTERVGTLRYLERDGWGAIWGLFTVAPDLSFFGLAEAKHVSIGYTGKRPSLRQRVAPAADPTMTLAEAAYLREEQAIEAVMDHIALTETPGARNKEISIVPVDVTVGPGGLGYPYGHEEHRGIIERAARHLEEQTRAARYVTRDKTEYVDLVDSPNYVANRSRSLHDDDVADHPTTASGVRTRSGMPVLRRQNIGYITAVR